MARRACRQGHGLAHVGHSRQDENRAEREPRHEERAQVLHDLHQREEVARQADLDDLPGIDRAPIGDADCSACGDRQLRLVDKRADDAQEGIGLSVAAG